MNFLAHLYLSGGHPKIMIGNFIGDFVKGRIALQRFEPAIIQGIDLHRAIDSFTDSHAIVRESKNRLRPKYRHYAGIIVDIFYDHFLAKNWRSYHDTPLPDFARNAYVLIDHYDAILPERVKQMVPYMVHGNWLVNYSQIEGIQGALTGMSRRTTHDSKMDEAIHDLRQHYKAFKEEFELFFPLLRDYANHFIATLPPAATA